MREPRDWETVLDAAGCFWQPCGSRVTCSVVGETSDYDYLVLCGEGTPLSQVLGNLSSIGVGCDSHSHIHYQNEALEFLSFKRHEDNLNLIVTTRYEFFRRHILATEICKAMDILDKRVRIQIFQRILYGNKIDVEDA